MNVLITGGLGFIGSELVHQTLAEKDVSSILVIDKFDPSCAHPENVPMDNPKLTVNCIDLRVKSEVRRLLKLHKIDVVYHLAAESHVDKSFDNPTLCYSNNVDGTQSLVDACIEYGKIVRFLHMSTDEVYGDKHSDRPFIEKDKSSPTNPYAVSKDACEKIITSSVLHSGFPAVIVRGNNVFGPRQSVEKVVPKFIQQRLAGLPFTIHGDGSQKRSFIHVSDMCKAIQFVAQSGIVGEAYNVIAPTELTIRGLAQLIDRTVTTLYDDIDGDVDFSVNDDVIGETKSNSETKVIYVRDRAHNDQRYWIDGSKLKKLGWKPNPDLSIYRTIRDIVTWYKKIGLKRSPCPMRVMIFGGKGWIGSMFQELLTKKGHTVHVATTRVKGGTDEELMTEMSAFGPTHIVSMLGRTHMDGINTVDCLETPKGSIANFNDNVYAPLALSEIANKFHVHYTYLGTGCIFHYPQNELAVELAAGGETKFAEEKTVVDEKLVLETDYEFYPSDDANFFGSSYSVAKGVVDSLFRLKSKTSNSNHLNVRIRMPVVGYHDPRNLVTKVLKYDSVIDIPNSITYLPECLPILCKMMEVCKTGTVHLTNPDTVSPAEIVRAIRGFVKVASKAEIEKTLKSKRSNCALNTDDLKLFAKQYNLKLTSAREILDNAETMLPPHLYT